MIRINSWNRRITENDRDLLLASALDPGCWSINFFDKYGCVQSIKNLLLEELKKYPQKRPSVTIIKGKTIWTRLQDNEDIEPSNNLKDQIKNFIAYASVWNGNCIEFWKRNLSKFSAFEPLLQKYLSYCASTAEVERIFSLCGHLVTKRRNRLSAENVENIIFLKYFYNIYKQEKEIKKEKKKNKLTVFQKLQYFSKYKFNKFR